MEVAIATVRPRLRLGPALRRARVPAGSLVLSALLHTALAAIILLAGHAWRANQPKTYIVNLVPAVAAIGAPQGQTRPPQPPSLPAREPARAPERTASRATELPERAPAPRESLSLPERGLPPRVALPRPGEKELPRTASAEPPSSTPSPVARISPPLGQSAGSPQGAGARTLSVSDFPYAWYIAIIQRKIEEQWAGKSLQGRQPEVVFEIDRTGQLRLPRVVKTSGNPLYDRVALRAVIDAGPFPPLPPEFPKPEVSIGMEFSHSPQGR